MCEPVSLNLVERFLEFEHKEVSGCLDPSIQVNSCRHTFEEVGQDRLLIFGLPTFSSPRLSLAKSPRPSSSRLFGQVLRAKPVMP